MRASTHMCTHTHVHKYKNVILQTWLEGAFLGLLPPPLTDLPTNDVQKPAAFLAEAPLFAQPTEYESKKKCKTKKEKKSKERMNAINIEMKEKYL